MNDLINWQMDYIYFFYGFSFFVLATVCFMARAKEYCNIPWFWMGMFGLFHGINEWLDLLYLSVAKTPFILLLRFLTLTISFCFLVEFGRVGFKRIYKNSALGIWIYVILISLSAAGIFYGVNGLMAAVRYSLGFGGAVLSSWFLYRLSKTELSGCLMLRIISYCLFLYAITAGVVVDKSGFIPACWVNYDSFIKFFGFPVQLARGILAYSLALLVFFYLQHERKKLMRGFPHSILSLSVYIIFFLTLVIFAGSFFVGYLSDKAEQELIKDSKSNLIDLSHSVIHELSRPEETAVLLSENPSVVPFLILGSSDYAEKANSVLDRYARSFGFSVCYLLNKEGVVVASSNRGSPDSFMGRSYNFMPYFKKAISGKLGTYFAKDLTSQERGYFTAYPVRESSGRIVGVCAIKINISDLDSNLESYLYAFLVSPEGVIFSASDKRFLFKSLWLLDEETKGKLLNLRQFGDGVFEHIFEYELKNGMNMFLKAGGFRVGRNFINSDGWSTILFCSLRPIFEVRLLGILIVLSVCIIALFSFVVISYREMMLNALWIAGINTQAILKTAHIAIFSTDKDGIINVFSAGAETLLGYSASEIIYRKSTPLIFTLESEVTMRSKELTAELGHPVNGFSVFTEYAKCGLYEERDWTYVRKDLKTVHISLAVTAQYNILNEVIGFTFIAIDRTRRNQAELALKESEQKFRSVVDNINIGVSLISPNMEVLLLNKQMVEWFPGIDVSKKPICYRTFNNPERENTCSYCPTIKTLMDGQVHEAITETPRGDRVVNYRVISSAIRDKENKIIAAIEMVEDITEKKKKDEELDNLKKQIEFILGVTKTGLDIIDSDFNMIYIDPEWQKVYGDYIGKKCYEYFMGHSQVCPDCGVIRAFKTKKIVVAEELLIKEGNRPVQVTTIPFQDDKGKWFVAEVNVDISERKKIEEELKRINSELIGKEKELLNTISELKKAHDKLESTQAQLIQAAKLESVGRLAAGVAHEVKNPLAVMLQGIDFLSENLSPMKDNVKFTLSDMRSAITRADVVIKELLDFSRISELKKTHEDINYVIGEALLLLKNYINQNNIRVVENLSVDLPKLSIDKNKIEQVFINLFLNSIQAMPAGGTLFIDTFYRAKDKMAAIEITDTGSGISGDIIQKIFEPFFTTKRGSGGTGLGLFVVKNIIDMHKGKIDIRNMDKGGIKIMIEFGLEV